MKKVALLAVLLVTGVVLFAADPITGLWKSVDDSTGLPKSISLIYERGGLVYGRILATFDDQGQLLDSIMNPLEKAVNIAGEPYYSGLDFIWEMEDRGRKWGRGKIMDPEPAKIYACDMWIKDGHLIVRGKIGPFGRNQEWLPASLERDLPSGFIVPRSLIPSIPEPK